MNGDIEVTEEVMGPPPRVVLKPCSVKSSRPPLAVRKAPQPLDFKGEFKFGMLKKAIEKRGSLCTPTEGKENIPVDTSTLVFKRRVLSA